MDQTATTEPEVPQRTRCEVYTRCVGYLRPIHHMNPGKRSEVRDRKPYDIRKIQHSS